MLTKKQQKKDTEKKCVSCVYSMGKGDRGEVGRF